MQWIGVTALLMTGVSVHADDPFRKLTQVELGLGAYRTANGLPAPNYWQQQVDYQISARLDPADNRISASAEVTYHNNSPDPLQHLFFALDHNALKPDSAAAYALLAQENERSRIRSIAHSAATGFDILAVTDAVGMPLRWRINDTHLQVFLPHELSPKSRKSLKIEWALSLHDKMATGARSGYERLEDGAPIYVAAQWFPRAVAYTDYAGWQLKPFLQQGEFSTEFGNYKVNISVPTNYVVAASGSLQNASAVLTREQLAHWKDIAPTATHIISHTQAQQQRSEYSQAFVQWAFAGDNVRDFAFSASPAFLWQVKHDARGRRLQQFYPHEAAPLWEQFGLAAIDHTLTTFDAALFPLDAADISIVNAAGFGMEYPGLATIATRPERTTSNEELPAWDRLTKYDFIGTVIHEVGHNYIPMRINTDEREWAWLDEGLVSFIEYRAEHSWEVNFDVIYGEPRSVAEYTSDAISQPVMSSADSLHRKIDNAYNKTASLLNVLRHLVAGADVFDLALTDFARHWQGKRPTPGDFFRAMETTAGTDLSWFWRSWFYQNHTIDLGIRQISLADQALPISRTESPAPDALAYTVGGIQDFVVDQLPELADPYTEKRSFASVSLPAAHEPHTGETVQWYTFEIVNHGEGLLPIPLALSFKDGSQQMMNVPAQTWMRAQEGRVALQLPLPGTLSGVCIDPLWIIPDTQRNNNCVEVQAP
ncbi:M1 family metallopeptidase [Microbulbifer salipaludis]|uniref:M1 family metallopeptidase n=1 Tax=Microbulbifer salipaludis TaxID=187980 RepID=A0ABS3E9K8_9GAMM|nr:M1 family metallopeptidase [Microbulbifer salipaludis]MBN8431995.1 M1 family metallopeptidase [Microbulbifer salipaludis]